jgi:hypothetical protein
MSFIRVGDDGQNVMLETPSSNLKTTYEVHIERRTGNLFCSCADAQCRGKVGHLLNPSDGCKHIRHLHEVLNRC